MPEQESRFFWQTIQETVALYTLLPMRILHAGDREPIFTYINDSKIFSKRFESITGVSAHIDRLLGEIPDLFDEKRVSQQELPTTIREIKPYHIRNLLQMHYYTKSSFNPFWMATLDASAAVKSYKMLFYLKILFDRQTEENVLGTANFLGFSYHHFRLGDYLFLIGPVMLSKRFHDETARLAYVKGNKHYFSLTLHTYELLNLLNQRNPLTREQFLSKAGFVKKTALAALHNSDNPPHGKRELREVATHFIAHCTKAKKRPIHRPVVRNDAFFKTAAQISDNQIMRDLEAIEWFNDFIFQHLSFENRLDPFDHYALSYLQNMLLADGYFIVNYTCYDHSLHIVPAQTRLDESVSRQLHRNITQINQASQKLEESYTWFVINAYQQHKNPICLIEDSGQIAQKFCPEMRGSILSISLVFEKRVFAVVHFVAQKVAHFDEIDQRFLLKLSSALGKRYIEYRLNHCLDQSLTLLEGLSDVRDRLHLQQKTDQICAHIADAFCSDGVILWFNQQEVFHTPKEANELTILSEVGFLSEQEKEQDMRYPLSLDAGENLVMRLAKKEVVIIDNLRQNCSDDKKDDFYMKYRAAFIEKGIDSMMFVVIKNAKGAISGALMLYDKSYRSYSTLARRMLRRI
ncbi:MAG TPA: GAF domain-containing protein, partial [Campylobacteraceae bacterium]|nr:GAF domain-containing protein [Campylobacteraceae bacterium]